MKKSPETFRYRPFSDLRERLEEGDFAVRDSSAPVTGKDGPGEVADDEALFLKATEGVTPLKGGGPVGPRPEKRVYPVSGGDRPGEITLLRALVRRGDGFVLSSTPEYMEGTGHGVPDHVARRLHQGEFSVRRHIDLHGLNAREAEAALARFLRETLERGERALLVIHGRGLSSAGEPVLKEKVRRFLTRSPWNKWIAAFSTARPCDGGAGATYVLLRSRPVKKRTARRAKIDKNAPVC